MSNIIKMIYAVAEGQLSEVEAITYDLNPAAEPIITGNVLQVADKLNDVSKQLEILLTNYQTLLLKNVQVTKKSVQYMKEQDEKISATIGNALQNKPYMTQV